MKLRLYTAKNFDYIAYVNWELVLYLVIKAKQADRVALNRTFLSACFASCVAASKEVNIKKGASDYPMHRKMHGSFVTTTNYLQEAFSPQEIEHAFLPKNKKYRHNTSLFNLLW